MTLATPNPHPPLAPYQRALAAIVLRDLGALAATTGLPIHGALNRVRELDPRLRWSNALAYAGGCLSMAMRTNDLGLALDAAHALAHRALLRTGPRRTETLGFEPWERHLVAAYRSKTLGASSAGHRRPRFRAIVDPSLLDRCRERVSLAEQRIQQIEPTLASEMRACVSDVRVFHTPVRMSFSTLHTGSTVFIGMNPGLDGAGMIEALVHEAAHVRLNQISLAEPLHRNDERAIYRLPSRPGLHAMRVLVHVPFVYARIERVLSRCCLPGSQARASRARTRFAQSYASVRKHAQFTPAGQRFYKSLVEDLPNISGGLGPQPGVGHGVP
jgi:HEXXH motif-containing protein